LLESAAGSDGDIAPRRTVAAGTRESVELAADMGITFHHK